MRKLLSFLILFLLFAVEAQAARYWVSKQSNGSQHCVNSASQPTLLTQSSLTITQGIGCLAAGDELYILDGTYNERISNATIIPSGTGDSTRTKLVAASGPGTVIVLPTAVNSQSLLGWPNSGADGAYSWLTFDGIIWDGTNVDAGVSGPGNISSSQVIYTAGTNVAHVDFINNTIRNGGLVSGFASNHNGILGVQGGGTDIRFIGTAFDSNGVSRCHVHSNGQQVGDPAANQGNAAAAYNFYITGGSGEIANCDIRDAGGFGIHMYYEISATQPHGWRIHGNRIYHNAVVAYNQQVTFALKATGGLSGGVSNDPILVYNNVVYNNLGGGILCSGNTFCVNNTVYGNGSWGIGYGLASGSVTLRNNIMFNNGAAPCCSNPNTAGSTDLGATGDGVAPGATLIASNNIYLTTANVSNGHPDPPLCSSGTNFCTNPTTTFAGVQMGTFVDGQGSSLLAANHNFALSAGSPAIDHGADLSAVIPATDIIGNARGAVWEIGAYAFGVAGDTTPPTIALANEPLAGSFVTKTSLTFSGTAADNTAVTSVTWSCPSGVGTASGTTSWSATITLNVGTNVCSFISHDAAGNPSTAAARTITRVAAPTPSKVAEYALDAGSGTAAVDTSGQGNNGTISGATWVPGKFGQALHFAGGTNDIHTPDSNSLDLADTWTLATWLSPDSIAAVFRSAIVKNNSTGDGQSYFLYAMAPGYCGDGGIVGGFTVGAVTSIVCRAQPLPTGAWTHLALTYNGTTLTLYVNGVAVTGLGTLNVVGGVPPSTGTLQIGNSVFSEGFIGGIDEPVIYTQTALTQAQIQTLMLTGITPSAPPIIIKSPSGLTISKGSGIVEKYGTVPP